MTQSTAPAINAAPPRRAVWSLVLLLGLGACASAPLPQRGGGGGGGDGLEGWIGAGTLPAALAPAAPAAADDMPAPPRAAAPINAPADPVPDEQARGSGVVVAALGFLGVHYRRGGSSSEQGFDCSGFTHHVFQTSLGVVLPRRARDQARAAGLQAVARDDLQPGDLVFFNTLRAAFSHVGIYVGEGRFIHAPRSGAAVRVEDMRMGYWRQRYDGARRAARHAADVAALPDTADGGAHAH